MPPLDRTSIHNVRIPQVSSARLPGAVFWALQREESFLEKETVVDFQVEEQTESRNHLNVTGAVVDRGCIETMQLGFSQAGFPLTGIGISLLALGNLVNRRRDNENETPVLLCQMGQRATSVSVLHNGRLVFTRNIPLGLQTLAETLVKELEPPPTKEEACALILRAEPTGSETSSETPNRAETVRNLLHPMLARTARQIERTIEYYQSNFDTEPMERIFLGGEIAARGHLFHLISGQLSLETIALDPFETPGLQMDRTVPAEPGERTAFGPAFGLALEGARDGLNLAHTYKDRQRESRLDKIGAAATLVLILVTGVATFFYHSQRLQLKDFSSEQKKLSESLSALGPRLTEASITAASQEVKALQQRRRAATKRYLGLALLSEISRLTPENIELLHISAAMDSAITFLDRKDQDKKSQNSANDEGTMVLRGLVEGERASLETFLTIYVARLDQSPLFQAVEVTSTELARSPDALRLAFTLNVQIKEAPKKEKAGK